MVGSAIAKCVQVLPVSLLAPADFLSGFAPLLLDILQVVSLTLLDFLAFLLDASLVRERCGQEVVRKDICVE